MSDNTKSERFRGDLAIPGENDRRGVTVTLDGEGESATLNFDEPVAGSAEWRGVDVVFMDRPKYREVQFTTVNLPKETVRLIWKMNESKLDDTVAGVVVARPNAVRVRGEKGFILKRL